MSAGVPLNSQLICRHSVLLRIRVLNLFLQHACSIWRIAQARRSLRLSLHAYWNICYSLALSVDAKNKLFWAEWLPICSFSKRGSPIGNSWMILSTSFIGLQICQDEICQRSIRYRATQHAQQKKSDICADITNEHLLSPKLPQNIPESMTWSLALVSFRQYVLSLRRENDQQNAIKQIKNYIHSTAADFQPVCKFFIFGRRQRPIPEDLDHQGIRRQFTESGKLKAVLEL